MISDSDEEQNVIARPQANQIQNEDLNNDEQNEIARSRAHRPGFNLIRREDLNIIPIVERRCCICLFSPPTIIVSPCLHQGLCKRCFRIYFIMPPFSRRPYYRCPLCRRQVQSYTMLY